MLPRGVVTVVLATVAAMLIASSASAQLPLPKDRQKAPPKPVAGRMSIAVKGGLATHKVRYYDRGQTIIVVGRVKPFVAGQAARLEVLRKGKVRERHRARIVRSGRAGSFVVRFKARQRGRLRLVAKHKRTREQHAFRARSKRVEVIRWSAGQGASGTKVLLLQRALRRLGFATPVTGRYAGGTARAVTAFRKTNGMGRVGLASAAVYGKVLRASGAFRLRYPGAGRHVEFDWSRQVLVLARRGRAHRVYHASSGAAATPTVFGSFRFYRKQPGVNAKGMVHTSYFIGGYAIHGYKSVPNYPASHGCIRVPIPNARQIFRSVSLGEKIFVYR